MARFRWRPSDWEGRGASVRGWPGIGRGLRRAAVEPPFCRALKDVQSAVAANGGHISGSVVVEFDAVGGSVLGRTALGSFLESADGWSTEW